MREKIWTKDAIPFQVEKMNFIIGETATGYTLQSSVDCKGPDDTNATWADYASEATPANTQHQVNMVPAGLWFRLYGNTGEVFLRY